MVDAGSADMVDEVASGRLGERVRELRRERGLTLDGLAGRSGVSRAMISKVERGEKNPTLVVAAKVAEGLGVSLSQLVGVDERREVVVVPRARRTVMRDPETGFERQLLSPGFGGRGVEFIRNVVREGSTSGRRATPSTSRPTSLTGSTMWAGGSAATIWSLIRSPAEVRRGEGVIVERGDRGAGVRRLELLPRSGQTYA